MDFDALIVPNPDSEKLKSKGPFQMQIISKWFFFAFLLKTEKLFGCPKESWRILIIIFELVCDYFYLC